MSSNILNILILHRMGDPKKWRSAVRELELALPEQRPEHNYVIHDAELPLPPFIKDIPFHAIIMGPTFLGARRYPGLYKRIKKEYAFLKMTSAYKIGLPQDDYDCADNLDSWAVDWRFDELVTVLPEFKSIIYPKFSKNGRIRSGYTGYVSNKWIEQWSELIPHQTRAVDVCYRASRLPPNFGKIGYIKGHIGEFFLKHAGESNLVFDISTDPKHMIPGSRWNQFIANSKTCLTTNSGSSILDRDGSIRLRVNEYLSLNSRASFEEVREACFKGLDEKCNMTALSPRNIEAALAGTVQIAVSGEYGGIFKKNEHYFHLEDDASNAKEVLDSIRDLDRIKKIANSAKEAVLGVRELRYDYHLDTILNNIWDHQNDIYKSSDLDKFKRFYPMFEAYREVAGTIYWNMKRFAKSVVYFSKSS